MSNETDCSSCETTAEKRAGGTKTYGRGQSFAITGMDCIEEVTTLKSVLGKLVGGDQNLVFDILNRRMTVLGDAANTDKIVDAVAKTGMTAKPVSATDPASSDTLPHKKQATALTAISAVLVVAAFLTDVWYKGSFSNAFTETGKTHLPTILLYVAATLTGGWLIFPKALYALRNFRPDINLLMVLAVTGAAGIGEWFEAATVTFLFSLSLALEAWSIGRARRAVATLMSLAPDIARVREKESGEVERPAKDVSLGSIIIVLGGERIPLDGKVTRGTSHVNQAPITGESVPVEKTVGAEVYAGTINGEGTLEVETTKEARNTTLANIIRLVGEAQSKRAPSEQWVDKFARIYTPAIILIAIAVFAIPVAIGLPMEVWFYRALVLLVIACPCALVISTPVSIVASLTTAARAGVLVKGGTHLETPGKLRALAVDKTGTITEGKPVVVEIIPLAGHSEEELLIRAGALEARSTHPLATAILTYAKSKNVVFPSADDVQMVTGKGVTGHFQGKLYWLGSPRYLQERKQDTEEVKAMIAKIAGSGRTLIVIGNESHVCGLIAVADAIRPNAVAAIRDLKAAGVAHVIMLTGDNRETALAIAAKAGINEVRAELLPEDKVAAIDELVKKYGIVGMIGDGVNDAPAMGRASLGIAMGAVGSDAAIESADIALMADDLGRLPWLVLHSRRTLAIIKQNIGLSLLTKFVFILLNFAGKATLWMAIAADMGATLVVIANALRLLGNSISLAKSDIQIGENHEKR